MTYDVAIVGAGPAGLGAAAAAARHGLKVVVLDEYYRPGGRLLGQLHEDPRRRTWFNGLAEAQRLVAEVTAAGVEVRCGVQVWSLSPGWRLHCVSDPPGGGSAEIEARAVILATGAAERPVPVPGWTLPGVISIGAGQIMANVHRVRPGQVAVIIGINVLSLTIARELAMAGVQVRALVLPPAGPLSGAAGSPRAVLASLAGLSHLAPGPLLRAAGWLGRTRLGAALGPHLYPRCGLRAWGMPIQARRAAVEIRGADRVESVLVAPVNPDGQPEGPPEAVAADLVCIAGGLYPLTELAAAAGCRMVSLPELGGQVPLHGPELETTAPGLFVAGNAAGVEGAMVALAYGHLAGVAVAQRLGALSGPAAAAELAQAQEHVRQQRAAAPIRFHPGVEAGRRRMAELWQEQAARSAGAL